MLMKEVLYLFKLATASPSTSYCVLCLRTDSKRRVIENNSLNRVLAALNDEEVWPWKHAEDKIMKVCYICEARLVSTIKVIELIRSGVMVDRLLQCYKKKQLIGVCSKITEHPLKHRLEACSSRFTAASACSTLFPTQAIRINIRDNTVLARVTRSDPKPSGPTDEAIPPAIARVLHPHGNQPKTYLGAKSRITTPDTNPPSNQPVQKARKEPPTATANPNYTLPPPQTIPQIIILTETLTITNSGKFLALKTEGESVVLHAIFQGTDGKSYVPTLKVMIEEGQLLPMPDFGINKFISGNTLPGVNCSLPGIGLKLPGLENILSTRDVPTINASIQGYTNASIQDNALNKPLGLQPKLVPVSLTDNKTPYPNLMQNKCTQQQLQPTGTTMPRTNIDESKRAPLSQFDPRLRKFDATPQLSRKLPHLLHSPDSVQDRLPPLEATSFDDLPNENLIDILQEAALPMENDPLEQTDQIIVPVPLPIKTEFDTLLDPNLNTDSSIPNFEPTPILFHSLQSSNTLSNVEKASKRLDILNNYKKPIVPLIPMKFKNNTRINLKTYKAYNKRPQDFRRNLNTIGFNKELSKSQQFKYSEVNNIASTKSGIISIASNEAAKNTKTNTAAKSNSGATVRLKNQNNTDIMEAEHPTVLLSDSESDGEEKSQSVQNVVKNPKLKDDYTMDWEDKIPMDVITYMDATDPMLVPTEAPDTDTNTSPRGAALGIIVDAYSERDRPSLYGDH